LKSGRSIGNDAKKIWGTCFLGAMFLHTLQVSIQEVSALGDSAVVITLGEVGCNAKLTEVYGRRVIVRAPRREIL
jgi:hypothetical protein